MFNRKNDKRTNNDLKNITQKTKDRATRAPLQPDVNSGAPEEFCWLCSFKRDFYHYVITLPTKLYNQT
jgi:hypothetical protein